MAVRSDRLRSVDTAWDTMSGVSAAQSWGVTAGLRDGYKAAVKNGFYPLRGFGWRLGTTGVVRDGDGGGLRHDSDDRPEPR